MWVESEEEGGGVRSECGWKRREGTGYIGEQEMASHRRGIVVAPPHLSLSFLLGMMPAVWPASPSRTACHQSGSSWLTTLRMPPRSNCRPASGQGQFLSSAGL